MPAGRQLQVQLKQTQFESDCNCDTWLDAPFGISGGQVLFLSYIQQEFLRTAGRLDCCRAARLILLLSVPVLRRHAYPAVVCNSSMNCDKGKSAIPFHHKSNSSADSVHGEAPLPALAFYLNQCICTLQVQIGKDLSLISARDISACDVSGIK